MKLILIFFVGNLIALSATASVELSYFLTQRNVFVVAAEDPDPIGLGKEITGSSSGNVGFAKVFSPAGLEVGWRLRELSSIGPLARLRIAPWSAQLRANSEKVHGMDTLVQVGHGWIGPSFGSLSSAFELGLSFRHFHSSDSDRISSTGLGGAFWGVGFSKDLWDFHTEASLMAFSLGSQGRWGRHRDSNSLRLKLARRFEPESQWKGFFEFFHLHRTFTGAEYGFSQGLFVSDVSLSLGVSCAL